MAHHIVPTLRRIAGTLALIGVLSVGMGLGAHTHVGTAHAAETATDTGGGASSAQQAAVIEALKAMQAAKVVGPAEVKLRDQATLKLPAGYVWVPEPAAGQYMKAVGNTVGESELGLIFPNAEEQNWMIVAEYSASGYIKDDDAKNWNVDELFTSLKEGTEAANEERREHGFPEMEIVGWVEKPNYTADTHRLIWSMSARNKGDAADVPMSINYNTYALGREGYITLNLITALKDVEQDKQHARALLAALQYDEGKRYADFNESTDKVAEYGLAALVGGFAAKKLGMFALLAGFAAKFGKVILLGGAGIATLAAKFFKKKQA